MNSPKRGEVWLVDLGYALLRKLGELDLEQLPDVENTLLVWLGFGDTDFNEEEE